MRYFLSTAVLELEPTCYGDRHSADLRHSAAKSACNIEQDSPGICNVQL